MLALLELTTIDGDGKLPKTRQVDRMSKINRAKEIGVSYQVLRNWERLGVDVMDNESVTNHLRNIRKMPSGINAEFLPDTGGGTIKDISEIDLDKLKLDLVNAQDRNTAQTIKTQIDGLLNLYKVEAAAGKYISRDKAGEEMVRVGVTFKAAIKRLEADLPPMLEGAGPEQMQKMIGEKCDEILRAMLEEYKKIDEIELDE